MPFNFRKTSTMKLEKGNYGTSANAKSDQGKYEAKVKEFLGYCKDFNNALAKMGNNGKVKNVEDIRTCFNSSFKNYYQKTKKYSLFSHTTRVLKGMEKNLKKLAKKGDKGSEGSLTINGMAGDLKKAFDYKPKRSSDAEKGKRSAIDDRAVYGFFTATLPKTLTSLCKKAKEEAVEALEEQNDIIDLIKKSFEDLGEALKQVGNELDAVEGKVEKQEQAVEELEEQHEEIEEEIDNGDADDAEKGKDVAELGEEIKDVKKTNEEMITELKELKAEEEKLKKRDEELLDALNSFGEESIKKLRTLLNVGENEKSEDILNRGNKEKDETYAKIKELIGKIEELEKKLKDNGVDIEKLKKKAEKLQEE